MLIGLIVCQLLPMLESHRAGAATRA
jgi:hypothetical protein